jgi:hypothetical protein
MRIIAAEESVFFGMDFTVVDYKLAKVFRDIFPYLKQQIHEGDLLVIMELPGFC